MIMGAQAGGWVVRGYEWPDDRGRWVEKIKSVEAHGKLSQVNPRIRDSASLAV